MDAELLAATWSIGMLRSASFRWWVVGGSALALHLGRSWRPHADLDVAVRRRDVEVLRAHLWAQRAVVLGSGDVMAQARGPADVDRAVGPFIVRSPVAGQPDVEITLSDGDDACWSYRRDAAVRFPWHLAVLTTAAGVPYLAPELVLLSKSRSPRAKDYVDAREAIPRLEVDRKRWLATHLPEGHPWQLLLR